MKLCEQKSFQVFVKFFSLFLKSIRVVDATDVEGQLIPRLSIRDSEISVTKQKSGVWDKQTVSIAADRRTERRDGDKATVRCSI